MADTKFTKGQSVTGTGRFGGVRYRVETVHRDGTYTVRALFFRNEQTGEDIPGFLGNKHRVDGSVLTPLPAEQSV